MYRTDDVTISAYLSIQNIDRRICNISQEWNFRDMPKSPNPLSGAFLKSQHHHFQAYKILQSTEGAFNGASQIVENSWVVWFIMVFIIALIISIIVANAYLKGKTRSQIDV